MNLTCAANYAYHLHNAPHWACRIGVLKVAAQPQPCGFFVSNARPTVMTGCVEQPKGWLGATPVRQLCAVRLLTIGVIWRRVYNSFLKVAIMNTQISLNISNIPVRQDADGRYCLNDLHKASGGEKRYGPSYWLENQQTKELIEEILGIRKTVLKTDEF